MHRFDPGNKMQKHRDIPQKKDRSKIPKKLTFRFMESVFCDFFHDVFSASSRDQMCVKVFWTKMVPGNVFGVFW